MPSQNQSVDSLDALLDLSQYDDVYASPSLSPATTSKSQLAARPSAVNTPSLASTTPSTLSGPSHQYELYKQQTPFVPGAIASTLAVNQSNLGGFQGMGSLDYLAGLSPENDLFDFNASPTDIDMEFDSPSEAQFLFPETTINPNAIEQESPSMPSSSIQTSSVGRLWPGAHSQAALAKQRQQQQQQMMQQRQGQGSKPRSKSGQPTDPLVEQKITQLLNSMRAKPTPTPEEQAQIQVLQHPRLRKDEEEMDEDERLLASEEGKKLSSKERRQLRNKVSARAFRSRRKEYISQLEAEIAGKVTENGDLRAQNRALLEENKRLSDLTRMLLSSSSFSSFLDNLSSNPALIQQVQNSGPVKREREEQQQQQQQQQQRQLPKDVNPYSTSQQHQIGLAMIPESNVDFSMLSLDNDSSFNFQPQVFTVTTPDVPVEIDTAALAGKSSNFVGSFESEDEKVEMPIIERPVQDNTSVETTEEELEADPEFELYSNVTSTVSAEKPAEIDTEAFSNVDIFGGIDSEKVLARYQLVDASEEEAAACLAMVRVQRLSDSLEAVTQRLELLTMGL